MTRRKRDELRENVIIAARNYISGSKPWFRSLANAVQALDEYEAAELTGTGARSVRGAPETSAEAAGLAEPVQYSARWEIINILATGRTLTDDSLEHRLGRSHQTVSSARNWLVEAGWVRDSGHRRKTRSNRMAVVWEITPAGVQQWKEMKRR